MAVDPATGRHRRGTSNTNARGSAASRRARKTHLLEKHGDGVTCPCFSCGALVTRETMEVDRIIPGVLGGSYRRENIRPSCSRCNNRMDQALRVLILAKTPKRTILKLCRNGTL